MFTKTLMPLLFSFLFIPIHAFAEQEPIDSYTVSNEYMSNYKAQYTPPIIQSKPIPRISVTLPVTSQNPVSKTDVKIKLDNIDQIGNPDNLTYIPSSGKGNLKEALSAIIPNEFRLVIPNETVKNFDKVSLVWLGGSSWIVALQGVLSYSHLNAVLDWNKKTVSIIEKGLTTSKSLITPVIPAISPPIKNQTNASSGVNKNPFTNDVKTAPKLITNPMTKTVVVSPPPKTWSVSAGTTLKQVFTKWASEEKCDLKKDWIIRWSTQTDYTIDSPLTFTGSFEKVTMQLFSLYLHANVPLYADGYKSQCLIVISDKK